MSEARIATVTLESTSPYSEILAELPEELWADELVLAKVREQSFWVNDGRTTALKASRLILETLIR